MRTYVTTIKKILKRYPNSIWKMRFDDLHNRFIRLHWQTELQKAITDFYGVPRRDWDKVEMVVLFEDDILMELISLQDYEDAKRDRRKPKRDFAVIKEAGPV